MYEYLDRQPQVGDVVEMQHDWSKFNQPLGKLSLVLNINKNCSEAQIQDNRDLEYSLYDTSYFKVVKTKPGNTAQVGDTIIRIANGAYPTGTTHTVYRSFGEGPSKDSVYYSDSSSIQHTDVLVLCKAQQKEQPMTIQQLLQTLFGAEKPTTDYDKRPAIMVVAYNRDGSQMGTCIANSIDDVKTKVADTPELWGCKVLTYTLDQEVSVDVPVKTTKAKVAKPTKE